MQKGSPFKRSLMLMSALSAAMSSAAAQPWLLEAARQDAMGYKSRGKGGGHSPQSSRPHARRWSTNRYDPRIQGTRQGKRQVRQGLHTAVVNGFSVIQTVRA